MNGRLLFNNRECQFNFDGRQLKIYANNGEATELLTKSISSGIIAKLTNPLPLPNARIEGYSYDDRRKVIFFVQTTGYGVSLPYIDYTTVVLIINVRWYSVQTGVTKVEKSNIYFSSRQFGTFLHMILEYKDDIRDDGKLAEIRYLNKIEEQKASFVYRNHNCIAKPFLSYKFKFDDFSYSPSIGITIDGDIDESDLISLIHIWVQIFSFLFMRSNVIPDSIKYVLAGYEYDMHVVKRLKYYEEIEYKNDYHKPACITWESVYNCFDNLFKDFSDEEVYLHFLDEKLSNRKYVDFSKISKEGAFFEYTFRLVYGDKIEHSSAAATRKKEIINELTELKNGANREKRKTLDYLIKQLDHVTLSSKIQRALKDYKGCCLFVREKFNLGEEKNNAIADTCANLRNWIDHGDKKANVDGYIADCFVILRCLSYSMYLRRWGLNDTIIAIQVNNLFLL